MSRAVALAAREAGRYGEAVEAWRGLLDGAPEDWQLALELKRDLKAGYHYPDSDPRFRRAARHLPNAAWLEHYAALYAFHGSDLAVIDTRARALLDLWPKESRLHAILGDVARQRRDWVEASDRFERAKALEPGLPEYGLKALAARRYRALAADGWAEANGLGVFTVNLDRNPERMVELSRQFAGVAVQRVAGVEGGRLSGAAVRLLTGEAASPRGTLGCFLSHAAAWESFLAGPWSHGLFLEDDVIPLLDVPGGVGALPLPEGFELCFVNDRMEPQGEAGPGMVARPLDAAMRAFHPEDNAPGGDGYILSRGGAAKLLEWLGADGFADHVDWRLLAYSLTVAAVETIPGHSVARRELTRLAGLVRRTERLQAYALFPALIRTVGVSSDREDEDRAAALR